MADLYPADMPQALAELPDLLDGNLAHAAEMLLGARPGQSGLWACEMAARLVSDEISRGPKPLNEESCSKFCRIISNATEYRLRYINDELVYRKLNFFWQILLSSMNEGFWALRYMDDALFDVRCLVKIFQNLLEADDPRGLEADNVA